MPYPIPASTIYGDCIANGGDPALCLRATQTTDPSYSGWTPSGGSVNGWGQDPNQWVDLGGGLVGLAGDIWNMVDPSRVPAPVYQNTAKQDNTPIYIGFGLLALLIVIVLIIVLSRN